MFKFSETDRKKGDFARGSRRPYRWWKARACIEENSAWGKRALPMETRVLRALEEERMQRMDASMGVNQSVYVPNLEEIEVRKKAQKQNRAVQVALKLDLERKWQHAHRQRVSADRKALECADALLRVGHSLGERTFTDDWRFWHGFTVNEDVRKCVDANK